MCDRLVGTRHGMSRMPPRLDFAVSFACKLFETVSRKIRSCCVCALTLRQTCGATWVFDCFYMFALLDCSGSAWGNMLCLPRRVASVVREAHNSRTCELPGASRLRELLAKEQGSKTQPSRVCRGNGPAALSPSRRAARSKPRRKSRDTTKLHASSTRLLRWTILLVWTDVTVAAQTCPSCCPRSKLWRLSSVQDGFTNPGAAPSVKWVHLQVLLLDPAATSPSNSSTGDAATRTAWDGPMSWPASPGSKSKDSAALMLPNCCRSSVCTLPLWSQRASASEVSQPAKAVP